MIIQSVGMRWTKETRGEPYASIRSRHPTRFPLPNGTIQQSKVVANKPNEQLLWHQLSFEQTKQGIEQLHECYEWLSMSDEGLEIEGKLPGVMWKRVEDRLSVHVRYHHSFGKPVRTNGQSGLLNEKAFELLPLQYGQIVINGRHTVEDGSLYEQRVINVWNVTDSNADFELKSAPDYQYKQMAVLW